MYIEIEGMIDPSFRFEETRKTTHGICGNLVAVENSNCNAALMKGETQLMAVCFGNTPLWEAIAKKLNQPTLEETENA